MYEFQQNLPSILDQIIASVSVLKPELVLIIGFLAVIISTLFIDKAWKYSSLLITILTIICSFIFTNYQLDTPSQGFFGMISVDNLSVYARSILLVSLLVIVILTQQHFHTKKSSRDLGDMYSMMLASVLGMHLLTLTTNWLMTFIAIETVSISSYILVGLFSESKKQSEAAMKYTLFGAVCAAIMLYGLSLIYGFTGNLDFASISHIQGLITAPQAITSIAFLFIFVGIGFKLGFVPFHVWTPDVYEGAPTPITAFLSTLPKIAVTILLSRLFQAWTISQFFFSELTFILIIFVAIVTMLVGNLIALRQFNIKRMMAYSSIGHTGFLMMAIISTTSTNSEILLFYLAIYSIMNVGVFALIDSLETQIGSTNIQDYAGLGRTYPLIFLALTVLGISLVGLPPTAGFIGKLLVFTATFEVYQVSQDYLILLLLIVGALTTVISLFYYFKIPLYSFLKKRVSSSEDDKYTWSINYIIGIFCAGIVIILGIFPNLLLAFFK